MNHQPAPSRNLLATTLALVLLAGHAPAQESVPLDEAQRIAQRLVATSTSTSDLPLTVDANPDKPVALKGGDAGVMIVPDKLLTADVIANSGKAITPVGQLWAYHVTLASEGKSVDSGKVRLVTVSDGDKSADVQLFLMGLAKNDQGTLELLVFSKGADPILRVPLTTGSGESSDLPIVISGRRTGEESATLTLALPGQHTADLAMVKAGN